jgi:regulator of replication initiation timing
MPLSSCVDLHQTPCAIEWQCADETSSLTTPDPSNTNIQFTIRLNSTRPDNITALFEILVPIKLKDIPGSCAIYIRICPSSVTSFECSLGAPSSEAVKQKFDSATVCLNFELAKNPTVLVPTAVGEPVVAARPRSGKVLDAIYQLSRVTALSVHIKDALLSKNQLDTISNVVKRGHLEPLDGPEYSISRLYSGKGAKIATLSNPTPPSYAEAAALPPPTPPPHKRKRLRPKSQTADDTISEIMAQVHEINKRNSFYAATLEAIQQENKELKADNAKLRAEVETLKKSHQDLEEEVAELRVLGMDLGDSNEAEKIEMQDDIRELANQVDFIDRGKDDQAFLQRVKREVLHDLAARLSGD